MTPAEHLAASCAGKVVFTALRTATRAAARAEGARGAYRCMHCNHFHVGRAAGGKRPESRQHRARRIAEVREQELAAEI